MSTNIYEILYIDDDDSNDIDLSFDLDLYLDLESKSNDKFNTLLGYNVNKYQQSNIKFIKIVKN